MRRGRRASSRGRVKPGDAVELARTVRELEQTVEQLRLGSLGADAILAQLLETFVPPIGAFFPFIGTVAPVNFVMMDGSLKATVTYPELFALIGYTYGGSGANFGIPDYRGRTVVGRDPGQAEFDTLGEAGGDKNLQAHSHTVNSHSHGGLTGGADRSLDHLHGFDIGYNVIQGTHAAGGTNRVTGVQASGGTVVFGDSTGGADRSLDHLHGIGAESPGTNTIGSGGSQNLQPYRVANWILRAL